MSQLTQQALLNSLASLLIESRDINQAWPEQMAEESFVAIQDGADAKVMSIEHVSPLIPGCKDLIDYKKSSNREVTSQEMSGP